MLSTAFTVLCTTQILHLSRHWWQLTRQNLQERRAARMKAHLSWETLA